MIDHFVIFSKTGTVLWSRTLCKLTGDPVDTLISRVLIEDRAGERDFISDAYAMQWVFENKLDLVFVVVYQKILQLLYIDELLQLVKKDFIAMFPTQIAEKTPVKYDDQFMKILKATELKFAERQARGGPRAFTSSRKSKGLSSNVSGKTSSSNLKKTDDQSTDDGSDSPTSDGKDKANELQNDLGVRSSKGKKMRTGPGRKASKKKLPDTGEKKKGKQMTKWDDSKLSKKEIQELDRSKQLTAEEELTQLQEKRDAYIGEQEDSESEEFSDTDDESIASSSGAESDTNAGGWNFSNTRIGNFLNTVSGNKILGREDLEPVVAPMHQLLLSKNVAGEVADELCESVVTTLVGQRLESFTRVSTVVRKALEAALLRILTPKKSTDVLREILEAKASGRAYSIVFVGVNGVGKSTSLSKVCYYLKSKGIKVLIAACDTFRSGAVEQLNQHAKVLDVPLFEKGYAKDPAAVAKEAIKYGTENGYDCVLIDTAGRMQNNEPLMRALAKLVSNNDPDLVLFVGEALVGNDGIDQLSMFDRALADYSDRRDPHRVDGIVITKFDTIDDKVGAAVSMVYKTGQPIMFVGTGLGPKKEWIHLLTFILEGAICKRMWVLDVINAADNSVENSFYLVAGEWSIGRKKCHFNFQSDTSISRTHALIRVGALSINQLQDVMSRPSLVLVDQNSRFGSFVNQEQCFGEQELKNGDHITFGAKRTILRVRYQVFTLVASRIHKANRARVNDTCQRIGMHLISSENKDATHCIMDPGRIVATVKVLWALVYNQPVVCTPWIYAILERKNLSDPLPRCEEFLPTDDNMPSVASNYLPNPMRKTLFYHHVVVFLTQQSMEELITAMDGIVISAYNDSENDDLLLRDIEQHASSRHLLIVEPTQGSGFSSTGVSGRDNHNQSCQLAAVDRRVDLFRSIGATFTTVQELAASVIFVKAPMPPSDWSFSNFFASHAGSSIQISSFPEHLSLQIPSTEDQQHEAETVSHVKLEKLTRELDQVSPVSFHTEQPHHTQLICARDDIVGETTHGSSFQVKDEVIDNSARHMTAIKGEETLPAPACDLTDHVKLSRHNNNVETTSIPISSNSIMDLISSQPTKQLYSPVATEWVSVRSQPLTSIGTMVNDTKDDLTPIVVSCNLVVKRRETTSPMRASTRNDVNFKRFRKGNGYGSRSSTSLFPKQTVVSVTVDNPDRRAIEKNLEALEEQERIAEELFAMMEKRTTRRPF